MKTDSENPKRVIDPAPPVTDKAAWAEYLKRWCVVTESGCWEWQRGRVKPPNYPYGIVTIKNRRVAVSRVVFEVFKWKPPRGIVVCHRCDNPPCCNPDHLFAGTQAENIRDCLNKGRFVHHAAPRGSAHFAAKLTEANVVEIRRMHASGMTQAAIGRHFCVDEETIRGIVKRLRWRHVPEETKTEVE